MTSAEILETWRGGLIVSCQAATGSPLARPDIISALAQVAQLNGAVGVRLNGAENIRATRAAGVTLPLLGIEKLHLAGSEVYITPVYECAARLAEAGADVIALDATRRLRPHGETLNAIVTRIKRDLGKLIMADVATLAEGIAAVEESGVEFVGTTLSGYTAETQAQNGAPDFLLVEKLARRVSVPVICEGRLRSPADVRRAFDCGAYAVVVGAALTGLDWLVQEYVAATPPRVAKNEQELLELTKSR